MTAPTSSSRKGSSGRRMPKIEVYRRAVGGAADLRSDGARTPSEWVAIVTDDHGFRRRLPGAPLQRHHVAPAPGDPGVGARPGARPMSAPLAARPRPRAASSRTCAASPRSGSRSTTRSTASSPRMSSARSTFPPGPTPRWTATPPAPTTCAARQPRRPGAAPGGRADPGGRVPHPPDRAGECARIFTGAPLPEGADTRDAAGGHRRGRATSSRSARTATSA